ncbi:hypothetical protein [Aeromicrobium sp.]|uniref:hypothetical protein n=1 Tax=Aeromicrobium sp. TaxID=1871063 RepID=UPI003D6B5E9B
MAENRSGLPLERFNRVGSVRYEAIILGKLARELDADCQEMLGSASKADALAGHDLLDGYEPARTVMISLSGAVEASAALLEVAQALLKVAEDLHVLTAPRGQIELVAAVEAVRTAVNTTAVIVAMNLSRITDTVTYDRVVASLASVDGLLAMADRITLWIKSSARTG